MKDITLTDAIEAYDVAARAEHGEFFCKEKAA